MRDRSRQRCGERHAPEGECRLRLEWGRASESAREALQHGHDDKRDQQHQPLHERAKYGRFRAVTMPFVHLHTHSEYSLLDGANRIPDLLDRVQTLGMDSLAITDHGNLHGAWSFYEEAKARKVRPILGFEAYLAFGSRHQREKPAPETPLGSNYSHLGLPAVATNDAHYLKKEDAEAHDVLLAIGTGKDLDDPKRFRFFGQESYVKSEKEMGALFGARADVISETARVADLCEFDFEKR